MAEIIAHSASPGRPGRLANPRIDLTPMVDLGFLLITFFIFTTSLSEPKTMEMQMPLDGPASVLPHHTAMTVFLGREHKLYYFSGINAMENQFEKLTQTSFTPTGIRTALLAHNDNVKSAYLSGVKGSSKNDAPFVIIKAAKNSDYSDLVNLLDELMISNVGSYALVDINAEEEEELERRESLK